MNKLFYRKCRTTKLFSIGTILIMIGLLGGCATVPPSSVVLSTELGSDIQNLHTSYTQLINVYYKQLRHEVNQQFDQVWVPAYINQFVKSGKLVENAKNGRSDLVLAWAQIAVTTIEKHRAAYLSPINASQIRLQASVDSAFRQATRANAAITAQLSSIRSVQNTQEDVLKWFHQSGLRQKINGALAKASNEASSITSKINKTAKQLHP